MEMNFVAKLHILDFIRGKVCVVLPELNEPYDLFVEKILTIPMDVGDILVTETSSPDFLPLLKKAGGIIADQGGLNSHAAIVSREFNIPCIVGTHCATEKLQTGDIVELDANNGVIRIVIPCSQSGKK
jgi:phosphoenolpyruvate synthase/pyruvate phosphate dikinase